MLLTNIPAKVKWNGNNKKYYTDKGYVFTGLHDEFDVNPLDLPINNKSIVTCNCDRCHQDYTTRYDQYILRKQEETYCIPCSKIKAKSTMLLKKVTDGEMSFYDWCIQNHREDLVEAWNIELNKFYPQEIYYNSQKSYWFNCLKNTNHEPEKFRLSNLVDPSQRGASSCRQCNSFEQWCIDNDHMDYLDLWDYELNTVSPSEISYGSHQCVYFKCLKNRHESSLKQINRITTRENYIYDCGKCNSFAQFLIDEYGEDALEKYWDYSKNTIDPWVLSRASSIYSIWLKCIDGHESFQIKPNRVVWYGIQCPVCIRETKNSSLHKKVIDYFETLYKELCLTYESDASLVPRNPKNNHVMPYDVCIESLKCVCEVHGLQHYYQTTWCDKKASVNGTTPEEEFEYRKWKDQYKKQYAIDNGYEYLEIPYTAERGDKYKELIDNKINEILGRPTENPVKMRPKSKALN